MLWLPDTDLPEVKVPLGFLSTWVNKSVFGSNLSERSFPSCIVTWQYITHAASSPYFPLPAWPQVVFKCLKAGLNIYPFLVSPLLHFLSWDSCGSTPPPPCHQQGQSSALGKKRSKIPHILGARRPSTGKPSAHDSIPLWLEFIKRLFREAGKGRLAGAARMKDNLVYYYQTSFPYSQTHRENIKRK